MFNFCSIFFSSILLENKKIKKILLEFIQKNFLLFWTFKNFLFKLKKFKFSSFMPQFFFLRLFFCFIRISTGNKNFSVFKFTNFFVLFRAQMKKRKFSTVSNFIRKRNNTENFYNRNSVRCKPKIENFRVSINIFPQVYIPFKFLNF